MVKILISLVMLFNVSVCSAIDLSKLDSGLAPGSGCENVAGYFYSVAKFERDKGVNVTIPKKRLVDDFEYDVHKVLLASLGRPYFDELLAFFQNGVDDIWRLKDISAEEFRAMTRVNCEAMKAETTEFISFENLYKFRQQSKALNLPQK
jgi:hypothetical protein